MNKMLFDFEQPDELLTPNIVHGDINEINPILTSSKISSFDENDVYFSSISSKKNVYDLINKGSINENSDNTQQQQHEDLFSTFDFPVLSEISRTDLPNDGLQLEKYFNQVSLPSPPMDTQNSLISDDSTFYPADDSASTAFPWVGEECTVESQIPGDMTVPPSPPLSAAGFSPAISGKESPKKRSLSTVERKLRKKDQNKTAAEKYRLKKRTERNDIHARHTELKTQNQELKHEFESISFQVEQFKQLFVDILQIPVPSSISH